MIERIEAHVQGQVNKHSITEIQNYIVDIIEDRYEKIFSENVGDKNWKAIDKSRHAAYLMFGQEHFVCVNSKNIEFAESFHYENFRPMTSEMSRKLKQGWVKDFLISLRVYRLGQFSYFAATITPLIENEIDCGAC